MVVCPNKEAKAPDSKSPAYGNTLENSECVDTFG